MRHPHRPLSNKRDFPANLDKVASDRWEAVEGKGSKKVITSKSLSLGTVYTRQLRGCRVQVAKKHRAVRGVVNSGSNQLSAGARHDWPRLRNSNSTPLKTAHSQLLTAWVSG